jgi:hypothetical protein
MGYYLAESPQRKGDEILRQGYEATRGYGKCGGLIGSHVSFSP